MAGASPLQACWPWLPFCCCFDVEVLKRGHINPFAHKIISPSINSIFVACSAVAITKCTAAGCVEARPGSGGWGGGRGSGAAFAVVIVRGVVVPRGVAPPGGPPAGGLPPGGPPAPVLPALARGLLMAWPASRKGGGRAEGRVNEVCWSIGVGQLGCRPCLLVHAGCAAAGSGGRPPRTPVGRVCMKCWNSPRPTGGCAHFPRFLPWANLALGLLLADAGARRRLDPCRHALGAHEGTSQLTGSSAWAAMASRYWGKPLEVDAGGRWPAGARMGAPGRAGA